MMSSSRPRQHASSLGTNLLSLLLVIGTLPFLLPALPDFIGRLKYLFLVVTLRLRDLALPFCIGFDTEHDAGRFAIGQ